MFDTEALFLVDDQQAEIAEADVGRKDAVGADEDVDLTGFAPLDRVGHLRAGAEARQHFHFHRERHQAFLEAFEVLLREDGGRHQHGDLLAVHHRLERGADGDLGLAVADVAADQAIHRLGRFHVAFDLVNGTLLVRGLGVGEGRLELALPGRVLAEGVSGQGFAHRRRLQQPRGEVLHGARGVGFFAVPTTPAEFVQARVAAADADVTRQQMRLRHRQVQARTGVVFDRQDFLLAFVELDLDQAQILADAVVDMNHQLAGMNVGPVLETHALRLGAFADFGVRVVLAAHHFADAVEVGLGDDQAARGFVEKAAGELTDAFDQRVRTAEVGEVAVVEAVAGALAVEPEFDLPRRDLGARLVGDLAEEQGPLLLDAFGIDEVRGEVRQAGAGAQSEVDGGGAALDLLVAVFAFVFGPGLGDQRTAENLRVRGRPRFDLFEGLHQVVAVGVEQGGFVHGGVFARQRRFLPEQQGVGGQEVEHRADERLGVAVGEGVAGGREHDGVGGLFVLGRWYRTLRGRIERADGFQFVAEELETQRVGQVGRPQVEQAAAAHGFAAFDHFEAEIVAEVLQQLGELVGVAFVAETEFEALLLQRLWRQGALHQRLHGGGDQQAAVGGRFVVRAWFVQVEQGLQHVQPVAGEVLRDASLAGQGFPAGIVEQAFERGAVGEVGSERMQVLVERFQRARPFDDAQNRRLGVPFCQHPRRMGIARHGQFAHVADLPGAQLLRQVRDGLVLCDTFGWFGDRLPYRLVFATFIVTLVLRVCSLLHMVGFQGDDVWKCLRSVYRN